jgi:YVTN family beta-propeller protein
MAINPAGTFAYVGNWSSANTVSKINLATDTVVATIAVGECPNGVAINPAGTFAYVTNQCGSGSVSKINLATDTAITIPIGGNKNPRGVAINPAGTFAYVALFSTPGEISKIALTATDPQSITFTTIGRAVVPAPLTQLFGARSVTVVASASSGVTVSFSSSTPTVCTVSGSTVTMVTVGDCTINANQAGGSGWDTAPQVSRTFTILPSPPPGEAGVSIKNGDSYVNTKQVTLNLIWPEYATSARISNDGGFAASKTQTKDLAASIDWELDDSVKGIYTKVVYVRFNGVTDTTKTYSDDIILDTTAPTIETSSAAVASSSVDVSLKATDDITGVDKVELKNGSSTVTKDYAANLSVPTKDLGLAVSSASVRKLGTSSIEIRVSDKAGNWSAYKTLSVSGTVTTPTVTTKKAASAKSIAVYAKLKVLSTSKVKLKVVASSSRFCRVSGTTLKGLKAGSCKVTVTVTPKKGKAISKTVTLKVTK